MKAAILYKIKDLRIEEIEKPTISKDEVLINIKSVGICGSDVHYYVHGKIGDQIVKKPHILGHEAAGEIIEIGSNVKNLHKGMRVCIEPSIPCGKCEFCLTGRYNICPNVKFLGTPPISGAYREFMNYPAKFVYPLPANLSYEDGVLIETLSVGVYATKLAHLTPAQDIAILGCGPIGIVTLKSVLLTAPNRVFITDLIEERLNLVKKYKNVITINAKKENPVEKIKKLTNNRGVDTVFESAGSLDTIKQTVEIVRIGGKLYG